MQITKRKVGTEGRVRIAGALDITTAAEVRQALSGMLAECALLTLELDAVESCDAAGLQVLYAARQSAREGAGGLRLAGVPEAIREAAAALGLDLAEASESQGAAGGV